MFLQFFNNLFHNYETVGFRYYCELIKLISLSRIQYIN